MLHLISAITLSQELVERLGPNDDVVLQQGLVWLAKEGHAENTKLTQLLVKGCRIFVLQEILLLVGIAQQQIITGVEVIDYAGLVALSVENSVIHTWC